MRLTDLTINSLDGMPDDGRDAARSEIRRLCRLPAGASLADEACAVEAWVGDLGPEAVTRTVRAMTSLGMADDEIHRGTVAEAARRGVSAHALALTAYAIGVQASVDLSEAHASAQETLTVGPHDGGVDAAMIPLSFDVYWNGYQLLVRQGELPRTAVAAAHGRRAADVVDHPALAAAGAIVDASGWNGFDAFALDAPADGTWRTTAADAVRAGSER